MYPIIFKYKFLTVGGYGIMLGLGFYIAFLLLEREFKLRKMDPELAYKILLTVIPSAIVGAKIFHIFENLDQFFQDPAGMIFSGAGLSVYGGYIVAILASIVVIIKNKENVLNVLDIASAPMALGYAIGRIGCHVSGDGCYGITTTSFLATAYPNGIVPSTAAVIPAPLFESLVSFIILIVLLQLRKRELPFGLIFFTYLIMNGMARFSVEFFRLNPKAAFSMTQAQIIAIFFCITGIIGIYLVRTRSGKQV
ncbi:MAG: hypothetical protein CVV44_14960 [Spirochaetae bacterium HGW-Spirochaetae-1]|jgi:phosphatidylglycerol:prolipoprotein diacylglycerol transferase|nr:MAG: hypothetical protein CVV44_14960 [Spirochaetae bacterium HGW-Spirochaetae-1]